MAITQAFKTQSGNKKSCRRYLESIQIQEGKNFKNQRKSKKIKIVLFNIKPKSTPIYKKMVG